MILADAFDAFLLDLDGVVWLGERPLRGSDRTIKHLRDRGCRVVFVTNNSSLTARDYAVKLARMNVPTSPEDIVTSGHAVIEELHRRGLEPGDAVHVCGGPGLERLLAQARFEPTTEERDVPAVVVGWNPKGTFDDIRKAANLVRSGAAFIASNKDATYPGSEELLPGTGAIVAAIEVASGRRCTVVGKPKPNLFRLAMQRAGVAADRALFIGDRPETDIAGARSAGIPTALVLTGVTTEAQLGGISDVPRYVLDSLDDLTEDLPHPGVDRDDDMLLAHDGSGELARLRCRAHRREHVLSDLEVSSQLGPDHLWSVLRRLLVEAVAGAKSVKATPELRRHLERLGVSAAPEQGTLPVEA